MGKGETGAFLLGRQGGAPDRVTTYVCYDDLDPRAYQFGAIAFHAGGNAALWQLCRQRQLQIIGDIHTHPGRDVRQSTIDQRNPMIPSVGHTALIVPNFGFTSPWSLNGVGIYQYAGSFKWRSYGSLDTPPRVRLTLW